MSVNDYYLGDPHVRRMLNIEGGFGNNFHEEQEGEEDFDDGGQEIFEARREAKLYQELARQGRYADMDKARHNKGYRNYLMLNMDDEQFGYSSDDF